ncbi:hypothetical protein [Methylobacterium pseudosasicola]|uniref:hypothetical protein n=1 Tax=Methylobacterium pseudosasicola TaxID=582667 RepID=UPI0011143CBD|nr:hypothetical protein [Methylobacterium pseudosasicola]
MTAAESQHHAFKAMRTLTGNCGQQLRATRDLRLYAKKRLVVRSRLKRQAIRLAAKPHPDCDSFDKGWHCNGKPKPTAGEARFNVAWIQKELDGR